MFNHAVVRLWNACFHPTVRLRTEFPWSAKKMAKTYGIALCYYIVGSFGPMVPLFGALWLLGKYWPSSLAPLVDGDHWLVLVAGMTILSFITGFGAELYYLRRAMGKDKLSLKKTLSINLDSLDGSLWAAIWRAAVAFGVANLVNFLYGLLPLPQAHDPAAAFALTLPTGSFVAIAVLMVVAAPICEELVFRGFLYGMLRSSFHKSRARMFVDNAWLPDLAAALVSGACFAAAHMNPSGFVLYMAIGVISAELYRRSGSLIPSMLFHAMNNLTGVVALIVMRGHI